MRVVVSKVKSGLQAEVFVLRTRDYIDRVNADPRPFRWTKSDDDIRAFIKRFYLRTLEIAE